MNTIKDFKENMASLQDAIIIARSMVTALLDKTEKFASFASEADFRLYEATTAAKELSDALRR